MLYHTGPMEAVASEIVKSRIPASWTDNDRINIRHRIYEALIMGSDLPT